MAIKFSDMVTSEVTESTRDYDMKCPKEIEKEAEALFKRYDVYANYIDDGAQYRQAVERNEEIIKQLKDLGVTHLSYDVYTFQGKEKFKVTLI